jgi:hypothetical protein
MLSRTVLKRNKKLILADDVHGLSLRAGRLECDWRKLHDEELRALPSREELIH